MSAVSTQLVRKLCGRVGTRRKVATLAGKVDALARHVGVVQLADGVYAGKSADLGWGRVYGGQTMAQAVAAAQATAGPNREMHQRSVPRHCAEGDGLANRGVKGSSQWSQVDTHRALVS